MSPEDSSEPAPPHPTPSFLHSSNPRKLGAPLGAARRAAGAARPQPRSRTALAGRRRDSSAQAERSCARPGSRRDGLMNVSRRSRGSAAPLRACQPARTPCTHGLVQTMRFVCSGSLGQLQDATATGAASHSTSLRVRPAADACPRRSDVARAEQGQQPRALVHVAQTSSEQSKASRGRLSAGRLSQASRRKAKQSLETHGIDKA